MEKSQNQALQDKKILKFRKRGKPFPAFEVCGCWRKDMKLNRNYTNNENTVESFVLEELFHTDETAPDVRAKAAAFFAASGDPFIPDVEIDGAVVMNPRFCSDDYFEGYRKESLANCIDLF